MKKAMAWITVLAIAGTFQFSALAEVHKDSSGTWVDENGDAVTDYWDDEKGIYVDEEGKAHKIEDTDNSGAITVISQDGIESDPNGGITVVSGDLVNADEIEAAEASNGSGGLTQEEWEARQAKALERNGSYTETWFFGPEKDPVPVDVVYMGLIRSMVTIRGNQTMVNTWDLVWSTTAPEGQTLAVINANRVGYAALRAKTSMKAFILDHCLTGRVVRVLSVGKNWSMVDYDGKRGYVLTDALTFYPNSMQSYENGLISYDGRTSGKNKINVRANPKNNSRILGDYALGTPLTIFSRDDKWCEVDCEGWHCYILSEYVTPTDFAGYMASAE